MKNNIAILVLNLLLITCASTAQTIPSTTDTAIHVTSLMTIQRFAVRIAKNPIDNALYYITSNGGVYKIKKNGTVYSDTLIASATQHYITSLQGFAFRDSMMYLVGNHKVPNTAGYGLVVRGKMKPNATWAWDTLMRTITYQSSATLYDHQFNGICIAPNGDSLYINSGSRTDHGEIETTNGLYPNTRDVALTSNIFQIPINPSAIINLPNDSVQLATSGYVYCRGVRNSFDIAVAPNGDILATENSGDRDDPEELNWLRKNKHYGFPWRMGGNTTPMQFPGYNPNTDKLINHHCAGWGNGTTTNKFYADATYPQVPAGITFTEPIKNYGPDADKFRDPNTGSVRDASNEGTYITSFTSHRSPLGLVFDISGSLAAPYHYGAFVLSYTEGSVDSTGTLANNSIGPFSDPSQDLLQLALFKDTATGQYSMHCYRLATNFAKPVDAFLDGNILYAIESHYPSDTVAPKLYAFTFPANTNGGTTPFLGKDTTLCAGSVITINPKLKGEYRYLWSTGATTAQLTVSPAVTTNYWLRIYNGLVTLRDTVTVVIAPNPNMPSSITTTGGSTKVCPGDSRTYTVALVVGISYNWLVPSGATIISGQGTRSIQVNYNSGFTVNGTLSVTASNSCGSSTPRNLTISRNVAATPSVITGPTVGLCGATNKIYTVTNVAGVVYSWTVPSTATIISGQGSNSIVVNFPSTNFSGNVSVRAGNACGQSGARNLSIKATPATPSAINGALTVCSNSSNNAYNISPIATATNYTFTGPSGSRITGNGITSTSNVLTTTATAVTINFGTVTAASTLKARANNNCGAGGTRTVTLTPCPARLVLSYSAYPIDLYPNPSNGIFTLEFKNLEKINYTIQVYDLLGKELFKGSSLTSAGTTSHKLDLSSLNAGMYLLTINSTLGLRTIKIIKEL